MKKIVLLGDSIRLIGYGQKVPELLGDEFSVWQSTDNCRFASYTLRMLFDNRADIEGADVIHWNNGLWDECALFDDGSFTPIDTYVATMVRIAKLLLTMGKRVIFATTTPVSPDKPYNDNKRIAAYNAAIVPILKDMGIIINDLHTTVSQDIPNYICDDLIHLSPAGIDVCAAQVADAIKSALV